MTNSTAGSGRASALPEVLPDAASPAQIAQLEADALDAIETVDSPEEAEELLGKVSGFEHVIRLMKMGEEYERRWAIVRLRAWRRFGQLLGHVEEQAHKGRGHSVTASNAISGADRKARNGARQVAAISEEKFEDYVAIEPNPTRSGLIKAHGVKQTRKRQRAPDTGVSLWEDETVLAWVARRMKAGAKRDDLSRESKAGEHGWPLDGQHLPQNAADRAIAIVKDRQQRPATAAEPKRAKRAANWNGKTNPTRKREIQAEKKKGNYADLLALLVDMNRACASIESYQPQEFDLDAATIDLIDSFHDDLISLAAWCDRALAATQGWLEDGEVRRKIAALRDTTGRDPEEAASYNRLADKLERKLEARLGA